jgi:hypothetical protein
VPREEELGDEEFGEEHGLPVFRVQPDAAPITPEMVRNALDER